jgi:vacuolar-type H+-ATPase subunit H
VVKAIVDKIRDAEVKAEKIAKDAETKAEQDTVKFARDREKRLETIRKENEDLRRKTLEDADARAKKEESQILTDAQKETNALRAASDKKKEEAISLIIRKILEQ